MPTTQITAAYVGDWQPSADEFNTILLNLHSDDTVRKAIEDGQKEMSISHLQQHIQTSKARLAARHLLIQQLLIFKENSTCAALALASSFAIPISSRGKPITTSFCRGDFSVSHVHDWVCCAHAADGSIGVDIAPVELQDRQLLRSILSVEEIVYVQSKGLAQHHMCFALYWSLKEAVLKALGLGLSPYLEMRAIALDFDAALELLQSAHSREAEASTTLAKPISVKIRNNAAEKWAYSCFLVEGHTSHLISMVKRGEDEEKTVEWRIVALRDLLSYH